MASPVGDTADRCGSCGNDLRATSRFCDACGSPVSPQTTPGEHKQVTVLFADVVGSMKLAATLDGERLQEIMHELFNRAAAVVQCYQGTVDKFTGDGLMALFGAPVALEDHALRACITALEIQSMAQRYAAEVLRRDGVSLQLRVGLNSGEVIAGEIGSGPGRYTAVGHPVGMAQRMEAGAPPNGILCSHSTTRLVEDATRLGPAETIAVKGMDAPVPARRLLGVEADRMLLGRNEGTMLGRDAEMARLRAVFAAKRGCLVGIVGAPGLGKSRLISELTAIVSPEWDLVLARCESHTTTHAFRALSRLLRAMFKVEGLSAAEARDHTSAQCGGLFSPTSADTHILFEAMRIADGDGQPVQVNVDGRRRHLVEIMAQFVLARTVPTVFVLEDAHWIDAPSDDVLAGFAARLDATTSVFVTTYRPEFRGALDQNTADTIALQPLNDSTTKRLVGQLLGDHPSLTQLVDRIAVAAVGNPFFAEEIVRDLAGRGLLSGGRGAYRLVADINDIAVPPTVMAVLAARIDRLLAQTKAVLNTAAVIGSHFDIDTLSALLPEPLAPRLAELVSAELIDQTEFLPQQRYCFRHPLVRAVAYESQLSTTRAHVHRRLAAALEARDPRTVDEYAGQIATHLEAAHEFTESHRWYLRAADWLRSRDLPAARAKWESAQVIADHLPDDHDGVIAMRIVPRSMLLSTQFYVGDDPAADERYRELADLARGNGDLRSLAIAMAGRIWSFTVNENRIREGAALAAELTELITAVRLDAGTMGIVLNSVAFARFADCEFDAALEVIKSLEALAGDVPAMELAPAVALRGLVECFRGDADEGWRHMREGMAQARLLPPVNYAAISVYWGILAGSGMCVADDLVDDVGEVLRRAESLGDILGLVAAQFSYGTVLLRADTAFHDDAIAELQRARTSILKRRLSEMMLPSISADLAIHATTDEERDDAIDDLRQLVSQGIASCSMLLVGCPSEALIELLIARGSIGDMQEAHLILNRWEVCRPGIAMLDLWWLRSRALMARAEGDSTRFGELAGQYLTLCEKVHAHGRLAGARQLVDTTS
jgi:adenylate cyclase